MGPHSSPMILNITICWGFLIFMIVPKFFLELQAPIANCLHNSIWVLYEHLRHNMSNIKILIFSPNLLSYNSPPKKTSVILTNTLCLLHRPKHLWITHNSLLSFIPLIQFLLKFCWLWLWIYLKSSLFTTFLLLPWTKAPSFLFWIIS